MVLPYAVRHHAGEHRILGTGQPFGQRLAPSGCFGVKRRLRDLAAAQHAEEARPYFVSGHVWIAARGNERSRRLATHIDNSGRHGRWCVVCEHRDQALLDLVQPGGVGRSEGSANLVVAYLQRGLRLRSQGLLFRRALFCAIAIAAWASAESRLIFSCRDLSR